MSDLDYDPGLLNDFGGGDVGWWQDYIRAEIGRCNDYWRERCIETRPAAVSVEALRGLYDRIMEEKPAAEVGLVIVLSHIKTLIDQAERREGGDG